MLTAVPEGSEETAEEAEAAAEYAVTNADEVGQARRTHFMHN